MKKYTVREKRQLKTSPWTIHSLNTFHSDYNESSSKKKACAQEVHLKTDGTHSPNESRCTVTSPKETYTYLLPNSFSTSSCRLYAILMALSHIKNSKEDNFIIHTRGIDLKSIINSTKNVNPLIQEIIEAITELESRVSPPKITLCPSSSPSKNPKATQDPAQGNGITMTYDATSLPATYDDLKEVIKNNIKSLWNMSQQNYYPLSNIQPISNNIYQNNLASSLNRKHQTVLTRLRIGHTNFTHIRLITKEDPKMCDRCNIQITTNHIITECPKFQNERRKYSIPNDLQTILNSNKLSEQLFKFLKDINLFNQI
ncbi:hypothetical protein KPH14_002662 [Odynerus spinipes]|nr:hypothetical protein KPH14_002662 [Odynerus spinipes]